MPQMTNLVVKNGASTPADVTFAKVTPASGFKSLALWQVISGASRSVFKTFTCSVDKNGNGTTILKTKLVVPAYYSDPTTGLPVLLSQAEVNADVRIPKDFPVADIADVAAFAGNLLATTVVKEAITTGTPVTG